MRASIRLAHVAAVILSLAAGSAAAQSVSPRPLERATDEHQALLMSRLYDRIDQAAEEARSKQLLTSDGQPLLAAIYAGTAGCACSNSLTDELWQLRKQRLDEWVKRKPGSVTARLSRAAFPVKYAWMARGGGYANSVSEEGWKVFRQRTQEGLEALQALDEKTRQDPGWYDVMLDIGMAQGWPRERYDALFLEAVGRHPHYLPYYFSRVQYYSPKWYGSVDEARLVVEDAVARTRSRFGDMLYARLNWTMTSYTMFQSGQTDWKRMKAGFEQMVQEYPDPWNVNNFAKFACIAYDFKTMVDLLPRIGDDPIVDAWQSDIGLYQRCKQAALRYKARMEQPPPARLAPLGPLKN